MGILLEPFSGGTGLALLILAHVLSDFAFQSNRMVREKDQPATLLRHGSIVLGVHALAWLPVLNVRVALGLVLLAGAHVALDHWKVGMTGRGGRRSAWFLIDQALHLASLYVLWSYFRSNAPGPGWLSHWTPQWYQAPEVAWLAVVVSAFVFLWIGGAALVRDLLHDLGVEAETESTGRGRVIGILERWLVLTFVLVGQWAALGLVIAAKAIVRYDKVHKEEPFAEVFLIGTLSSVLVAVVVGIGVRWLVA